MLLQELKKYDLKARHYLGPTSLDPALALLMATVSGVQAGSLVLDPFVGTASILVRKGRVLPTSESYGTNYVAQDVVRENAILIDVVAYL